MTVARNLAFCVLLTVARLVAAQTSSVSPVSLDEAMQRDAVLHDIEFVDQRVGWAVGDRGVVWHTTSGGEQWQRQNTPTSDSLHSVSFVDAQRGWAVGGRAISYTNRTAATLLRTLDGGHSWSQLSTPTLPRLIHVKFFDAAHGVVVGESSAMYPSGVFVTTDGGKSWTPVGSETSHDWQCASFVSPEAGVLIDRDGRWAQFDGRRIAVARFATGGGAPIHAVQLTDAASGWRVGSGTLVQSTTDAATTWIDSPTSPLSPAIQPHFEGAAVCAVGTHLWIAGNPGSRVLHSRDGGRTWNAHPVPTSAAIFDLEFKSQQLGWAVGALGTILHTRDGGESWTVQRSGGRTAAVWLATPTSSAPPLELVAHTAAAEGLLLSADQLLPKQQPSSPQRSLRDALVQCGATESSWAWRLAIDDGEHAAKNADQLLARLNARSDNRAQEWLTRRAWLQLLVWRPDVVVVPHPGDAPDAAADQLVEQVVMAAIELAAKQAIPELGLGTHQVKRVVGIVPASRQSTMIVPTGEFATPLATTPEQFASAFRGSIELVHRTPPPYAALELIQQAAGLATPRRDLTTGMFFAPGGGNRRVAAQPPTANLAQLKALAQRRKHLVRLLEFSSATPGWSGQVVNMTGGLDAEAGGQLLFQLAEGYRETARFDLAADTYFLLCQRYPQHALVEKSLEWLIGFYGSSELAHAASMQSARRVASQPLANVAATTNQSPVSLDNLERQTTSLTAEQRLERAKLLGDYMSKSRPAMAADPSLGSCLAAVQRQRGFAAEADRFFVLLSKSSAHQAWLNTAAAERWLADPSDAPPSKPIATCRFARQRPRLDGQLDDPIWQQARSVVLAQDQAAATTQFWLARDGEFLYVAAKCATADQLPPTETEPRSRDANLINRDRIAIRLDTDRDYHTSFDLTVDHRGWTHDACWGDTSWNPQWYVAQSQTDNAWQVEAAIPWSALTSHPPDIRAAWSLSLGRMTPGNGQLHWPQPGPRPENWGLLLFE